MELIDLETKIQEINRRILVLQIAVNDLVKSISEYVNEANKEIMRLKSKEVVKNESQEEHVEQGS